MPDFLLFHVIIDKSKPPMPYSWYLHGRRKRYGASKRPDINDPVEKWVDYLKLDKSDLAAMYALQRLLFVMQGTIPASDK